MCYDIKVLYETALKRARRKNDPEIMKAIEKELKTFKDALFYHVSGYAHPHIPVYASENPFSPKMMRWGFIPGWAKTEKDALKLQNNTLNARAETILEKSVFKEAAIHKRCLIFVDGFYEHHHFKGKTYPYFIHTENAEPLCIAGLWDEWINKDSGEIYKGFSIVTTRANELMKKIHNNPKLAEARMPLLLDKTTEESWLSNHLDKASLQQILLPNPKLEIIAHTVRPLRGKFASKISQDADKEFVYSDLNTLPEFEF